jgi:ammonia channel protein AmtB
LIGFAFAFGKVHKFIGLDARFFASSGFEDMPEDNYLLFVFHVAFALTSSTIVLGALAERTKLLCYIIYIFIHTSIIYPIVVAWTFKEGGWLHDLGYYDFAGASTVFMVGGMAGLCGTALLGERYGKAKVREAKEKVDHDKERALLNSVMVLEGNKKFEKVISQVNQEYHEAFKEWLLSQTNEFRPYNQTFIVTGALIVSVGWLFLTGGSCSSLFDDRANIPPKIIMNTLISGCTSSVLSVYIKP